MTRSALRALVMLAAVTSLLGTAQAPRTLTFEERVRAQEAIERVYYAHQIGATKPFEQAVPREALEKKVRTYLQQSVALQEFWSTPITSEALQHELARIARGTRFPERLQEILAALGDDPFLIHETFARASLAGRVSRNFFAFDERIHGAARAEAEEMRQRLASGDLDIYLEDPRRTVIQLRRRSTEDPGSTPRRRAPLVAEKTELLDLDPGDFARFRAEAPAAIAEIGPVRDEGRAFVVRVVLDEQPGVARFAVYTVPKRGWDDWWSLASQTFDPARLADDPLVQSLDLSAPAAPMGRMEWPGSQSAAGDTSIVLPASPTCVADDTWDNGILDDSLEIRANHLSVWTGTQMIIWGGATGYIPVTSGHRYDPLTDSWMPMSSLGAPQSLGGQSAVWTGSEIIVWGGVDFPSLPAGTGGRYDPVADVWRPMSTIGAPPGRGFHSAIWTGSQMVVWGGQAGGFFNAINTGGLYSPSSDSWSPLSNAGAPSARFKHTAVWTGDEMIVWGGTVEFSFPYSGGSLRTGGRYNPASDSWTPVSATGAPLGRALHSAVWTGAEMIVWGGVATSPGCCTGDTRDGGRYDPATDSWAPMASPTVLSPRHSHTAIWNGSSMFIWGGAGGTALYVPISPAEPAGARYDPTSDSWTPISSMSIYGSRYGHTAVWTGSAMIVWGGVDASRGQTNTGGRYDPVADSWTPTAGPEGPKGVFWPTAVWTGNEMIAWGPDAVDLLNDAGAGARYDPLLDAWAPVATLNSPRIRYRYSAVWSGDEMLVWSADHPPSGGFVNSGGRYNPLLDSWSSMSTLGAPTPREIEKAFWTGREMLIWGGLTLDPSGLSNEGGLYDPTTDSWRATSLSGAPSGGPDWYAVWTGTEMIVWRGHVMRFPPVPGEGGRYDPQADAWAPISMANAPEGRTDASVVWTGTEMLIWGGQTYSHGIVNYGGSYTPSTDVWHAVSGPASLARSHASTVWTGSRMIVWGGMHTIPAFELFDTGGLYDPVSATWTPTSTVGAPFARYRHGAVWTGAFMIVWGGVNGGSLISGGRYALGQATDDDLDGFSECAGDCIDTDPAAYPGAPQTCGDGMNNDCLDPAWPSPRGTNEADDDGDSFTECQGDCNDEDSSVRPGAVERPGNAVDEDCDGVLACDPGRFYRTHGMYVSCVSRECDLLVASGFVSQSECDAIVSHAAGSNVGRRQRMRTPPTPTAP